MAITLSPDLETIVREKVMGGTYDDAYDVVREALQFLDERERMGRLQTELASGLEQIERGATIPYTPNFIERLKREAAEHVRLGKSVKDGVTP